MSVITLTSDFGIKDYMIASVKGSILKELPDAKVVDITHEIEPFNISETAFVIKNVYPDFPENTVHILGVDALPNKATRLLAAKIDSQYFISADNGILSLILAELKPEKMVEITLGKYNALSNFPTRDIFVPVACHLIRGGTLEIVGNITTEFKELNMLRPAIQSDKLMIGTVIYVDNFGNVITNINKKLFDDVRKGRDYEIYVRNHSFNKMVERYADVVKDFANEVANHGDPMVLFNSANFLEIAMYKSNPNTFGSASSLFGLKIGDNISVEFS